MTRVRAVGIGRTGGPEVLQVIEREVRPAGPDEVRISVRAAGVNPADIALRESGSDGEPPWVPGLDAAGVVESVGAGVSRFRVGERVMAALRPVPPDGGAQAELIVVPAGSTVPMPDGVTFAQAATLPMNGLTALLGLDRLGLAMGQTLAVSGGAGVLASYVIPLAKRAGLRVLADAHARDAALVGGFGADLVLPRGDDYPKAIREAVPDGVDGFFDAAPMGAVVLRAIRDRGGVAAVRRRDGDPPERGIQVHAVLVRPVLGRTDWLQQLRQLASQGILQLRVAGTYAPEEAAEAHLLTSSGASRGRAVIAFRTPEVDPMFTTMNRSHR